MCCRHPGQGSDSERRSGIQQIYVSGSERFANNGFSVIRTVKSYGAAVPQVSAGSRISVRYRLLVRDDGSEGRGLIKSIPDTEMKCPRAVARGRRIKASRDYSGCQVVTSLLSKPYATSSNPNIFVYWILRVSISIKIWIYILAKFIANFIIFTVIFIISYSVIEIG